MSNVQIRNVPDEVHRQLKARASASGQSLNEYLLGELRRISTLPTWSEMSDRVRRRPPYTGPPAASFIREDRDAR